MEFAMVLPQPFYDQRHHERFSLARVQPPATLRVHARTPMGARPAPGSFSGFRVDPATPGLAAPTLRDRRLLPRTT
jgi:hypothetical protein